MSMQVFTTFTSQCGGPPPCVGSWSSDQIEAMVYIFDKHNNDPAFTNKIVALNLSLGGSPRSSVCDGTESARLAAVNNLRSVGIATVAASGNSGTTNGISAPACISSVVSVGSTTKFDIVSEFSNFDDFLDLLAPGDPIISSLRTSADPNVVIIDPAFGSLRGTSMASPHVAGAWAILKQKSPDATVDQVLSALKDTGVIIEDTRTSDPNRFKPRIDVDDALATFDTLFCGRAESSFNKIQGTAGDDTIRGTINDDLIFGGPGNDQIQGLDGDDCIFGEDGNDVISGGNGNDEISGGAGADQITGRAGNDTLFGNEGDDVISGGNGNDTIYGGAGDDQITGRAGADELHGNEGNDLISGGLHNDTIYGEADHDLLLGRSGDDTLDGGSGADSCFGGSGTDSMINCENAGGGK